MAGACYILLPRFTWLLSWSISKLYNLQLLSADFHDYHHRVLYTKSGNHSSTSTYMDWEVIEL